MNGAANARKSGVGGSYDADIMEPEKVLATACVQCYSFYTEEEEIQE
jgi:hypothetical protein